ncbi:MAG: hypothetical protein LBH04_06370 [Tannerellaceae bacterium]|jgi:hypothetical protein|nr:hypothetical protein [Tannerellaceae bacterium]
MRDNYYILLELDPSVRDEASINKAITAKQQQWSSERNHPTKGNLAQQYLGKLSDIKTVLLNPELRNTEAEEAKKILLVEKEEKNKKLKTAASILVKNGEIKENDLKALAKKFKLLENEITTILKVRVIKEEVTYKDDGIQLLDESVIKKIRSDLNLIRKKDLFDFLGLLPTSSCTVLWKKATEIYNQSSRNANKTAEITATNSLATTCLTYLKDETVKKRYQKSLQYESFDEIKELIDLAANDGSINVAEYQKLIAACTEKGLPLDRAEFYIYDYCLKKKYPQPQKVDNPEYRKQVQCGVCGHLNEPASNNCTQCTTPLKLICPKCGNAANSIDKGCSKCGFSIGDMPNAIPLIRDAKVELANGNFETAKKLLKEAELLWATHPDIVNIRKELEKENVVVEKIAQLIREKKFVEAQKQIIELKKINNSNSSIPNFERQCNEHITLAENYCRQARTVLSGDRKLDLFLSALEECADYNDAIQGASSIPVEPPTNLTVTKNKQTVSLRWTVPTNNKALKYRIIRKEGSIPVSASDGEILAEVEFPIYDDLSAKIGKNYYYAVFSIRGKNYSNTGAVKTDPVSLDIDIEEVKNLKGYVRGGILYLEWTFPAGCETVKIEYSHLGFPNSSNNANSIADFTKEQYDRKRGYVINQPVSQDYYFRVYSCFKINNTPFYSKGVNVLVTNSAPIIITYKVVIKKWFSQSAYIKINSDKQNIVLPEIIVIANQEGRPTTKKDGRCIMTIPSQQMTNLNIPLREVEEQHIRLFFANENDYNKYRLNPT